MSTERLIVEAKRAGFVAGAQAANETWSKAKELVAIIRSQELFPLPTYKRPRVIRIPNNNPATRSRLAWVEYRVDRRLEYRVPVSHYGEDTVPGPWTPCFKWTPATLRALLALFENPTETVEVP